MKIVHLISNSGNLVEFFPNTQTNLKFLDLRLKYTIRFNISEFEKETKDPSAPKVFDFEF